MANNLIRWFNTLNYPSYIVFFVTARCNARCKMCFYEENMKKGLGVDNELTLEEYEKISKNIKHINIMGISGGEPFLREDLSEIINVIYKNCSPMVVDLPTNGFFTGKIIKQVENIVKYCKDMVVDLQLSIDAPGDIHNEIRGLKNGFKRVKETYNALLNLKKSYKNLKVKACVVYSHYNQNHINELFGVLNSDFSRLDRVVFSVVHGSVSNAEALDFNWDKYFDLCDQIRENVTVKKLTDFHSILTIALRMVKNDYLKKILNTKDFYKQCKAGKKVIVVNEIGKVFPCEPLWHSVGDLRQNNYDINTILNSVEMKEFNKMITKERCTCHWGLPISNSLIYKPSYYPAILFEVLKVTGRSVMANVRKGG